MVNVTIKASMRHGDLHLARKKVGNMEALAKLLDVSVHTVGSWYRYESCPPVSERLPYWPQAKLDELEKKLFALTGKLLDDLFPEAVRDKAFLRLEKTIETTKEVDPSRLIAMAGSVRRIQYKEPDVVEAKELSDAVQESISTLSKREQEIVRMRYGFSGEQMTYDEIGSRLKITRERVRQIEMKAIRKLQMPNASARLAEHAL